MGKAASYVCEHSVPLLSLVWGVKKTEGKLFNLVINFLVNLKMEAE